jgi:3',5'-cyclic AMP phosphodiesterase CpdA
MQNFCDTAQHSASPYRNTMTQPYAYWTLDAPFVTIIGLYSNIGGSLDARGANEQQQWFEDQMKSVPIEKKVIVAVHHPPFSLDSVHGGYPDILTAIDRAVQAAGRPIHGVLSGHVHNYQRFSRPLGGHDVPYIVAGAGGYATSGHAMHLLQKGLRTNLRLPYETTGQGAELGVTLRAFNVTDPGYLRVTVTPDEVKYEYVVVPFDNPANAPAAVVDSVSAAY